MAEGSKVGETSRHDLFILSFFSFVCFQRQVNTSPIERTHDMRIPPSGSGSETARENISSRTTPIDLLFTTQPPTFTLPRLPYSSFLALTPQTLTKPAAYYISAAATAWRCPGEERSANLHMLEKEGVKGGGAV